ncbi:heavy-metal-associated domain-containing protein [Alcaligenaceae bacterium SJ-26]|nr:heavy-metal-associated domain-containing protein [Alcaligenaceae bacterium SJ-26]
MNTYPQTLTWTVRNLNCSGCASRLLRLLNAQDGVIEARVEVDTKNVELDFDPRRSNPETLRHAIEAGGFAV